jgi:hypothetical protein
MKGFKRAVVVMVAAALLSATAAFGAGLSTESATITVTFEDDTVTAECSTGKPVSGGFEAEDSDVSVISSAIASDGWALEASSDDDMTDLTAYVHCAKGRKVTTQSASTNLGGDSIGSVTARCEGRKKAASGGFFGETGLLIAPFVVAHESRKSGARGWKVSAGNYGFVSGELTAYVNCRKGKGLKSKSKSITLDGGTATASLGAKCKRGGRAISGGFAGQVDSAFVADPPTGVGVRAYASRRDGGRRWQTTAANAGEQDGSLTTYVYCQKKPRKK